MKQLLLVFLGGGAGSVLRYLISKNLNQASGIPIGTLTVNIFGSLLIGAILGLGLKQGYLSTNTTLLLATGFCGGFTTFSAFAFENQEFLKTGNFLAFGVYTIASIGLGIGAVFLGIYITRFF